MGCAYCEEFKDGYFELTKTNRMLWESDNYCVFPSLGQIVEGYLLIATKQHYISMSEIPNEIYGELENVINKVRNVLKEYYGIPLFFEHGPASASKKGGCCIEHAHLHAVPVQVDVLSDLSAQFYSHKISSFPELKELHEKNIPYFFLETNQRERNVFEVPNFVPSQYIRRIIAKKIGKPERWDWRTCYGIEELNSTLLKLGGKFA